MDIRFSEIAHAFQPSQIRNKIFDDPGVISFAAGKPDSSLFPTDKMKQVFNNVIDRHGEGAFQYSETEGLKDLRTIIANQRMEVAGVNVNAENIALTSGAQQGIEFSAKIFVNEGDVILTENPSYTGALSAFKAYRPKCVGVTMDNDGMKMEELEEKLQLYPNTKMIYTIPDFQNPTCVTMSIYERKRLAELGAKYKVPIVEDCPYGDIIYEGKRYPSVKSFDTAGWVIYLGSFSKVFVPGLRIGWVCASAQILEKYIMAKQNSDLQCSSLNEVLTIEYMQAYDLEGHINKIKQVYKARRDLMLERIKQYFPEEIKYTTPNGGFFIWLELKQGIDANEILEKSFED